MSLFDYINYTVECPTCSNEVKGFQSKDGPRMMKTLEYWEVDNFYAMCDVCHSWIEFKLKSKYDRSYLPIEAYEMSARRIEDGI